VKIPKGWKELTPGDVIRADDKILAWGGLKFVRCGLKFVRGGLKFVRCGKAKTPSFSPPVGERYLHDYPHHLTIRKFKNIKMKSTPKQRILAALQHLKAQTT